MVTSNTNVYTSPGPPLVMVIPGVPFGGCFGGYKQSGNGRE
jgi:acyl-CoA reductase-like NAD-dependent aldehyde dehydrogenase